VADAVGAMLGDSNRKLEKARGLHQRAALRYDVLSAVNTRRKLRLYIDHQKKRLLGSQAHRIL
jgi:hypothetical protein